MLNQYKIIFCTHSSHIRPIYSFYFSTKIQHFTLKKKEKKKNLEQLIAGLFYTYL